MFRWLLSGWQARRFFFVIRDTLQATEILAFMESEVRMKMESVKCFGLSEARIQPPVENLVGGCLEEAHSYAAAPIKTSLVHMQYKIFRRLRLADNVILSNTK